MIQIIQKSNENFPTLFYANVKQIKYHFLVAISLPLILCGCGKISTVITAIEHPFEAIFSSNHLVEYQHGVQQQNQGRHDTTLVWSTSNHTISDRSSELFSKHSP